MIEANDRIIKVGLFGASLDNCNKGVTALANSSIKCILHRWPQAEIVLFGNSIVDSEHCLEIEGRKVWVRDVSLRISKNIFLKNHIAVLLFNAFILKVFPFEMVRKYLKRKNSYLSLMLEMDVFADITGGDSFSDIYGTRRFIIGFFTKILPLAFGGKFILLPQTYGPFKGGFVKILAKYILLKASMILSRDQEGADTILRLLPGSAMQDKVYVVPDVAFVLESHKPEKLNVGALKTATTACGCPIVVGINVSGLLYYGGFNNSNMFGLKEDYGHMIRQVVNSFLAREEVVLLLIPHIIPPLGWQETVENDVAACEEIEQEYLLQYSGRVFMAKGVYDQCEIKYIIGLCDFFLGSRMHSCIAALSQNIPAIGLAYSKKFLGVFKSVGVEDLVIDLRDQSCDEILSLIDQRYLEREKIAERLSKTIPVVQEATLEILAKV